MPALPSLPPPLHAQVGIEGSGREARTATTAAAAAAEKAPESSPPSGPPPPLPAAPTSAAGEGETAAAGS